MAAAAARASAASAAAAAAGAGAGAGAAGSASRKKAGAKREPETDAGGHAKRRRANPDDDEAVELITPAVATAAAAASAAAATPTTSRREALLNNLLGRVAAELQSDDSKADDPAELRRMIAELHSRPVRDHFAKECLEADHKAHKDTVNAAMFASNLVFPDTCEPGSVACGVLVDTLCTSTHNYIINANPIGMMSHALELSLLLRLLVALGGDVNLPMYRVYPCATAVGHYNWPVALGKPEVTGEGWIHAFTTTALAAHLYEDHVALAVGMAARRLRADWETVMINWTGRPVFTSGYALCTFTRESAFFRETGCTISTRDVLTRLVHVIGERGAFFRPALDASKSMEDQVFGSQTQVLGRYADSRFATSMYEYQVRQGSFDPFQQFANDNTSEFLFPYLPGEFFSKVTILNRHRTEYGQKYNALLSTLVDCDVFGPLTKTLWPLVVSFALWRAL